MLKQKGQEKFNPTKGIMEQSTFYPDILIKIFDLGNNYTLCVVIIISSYDLVKVIAMNQKGPQLEYTGQTGSKTLRTREQRQAGALCCQSRAEVVAS